jgi:hypothetical protein
LTGSDVVWIALPVAIVVVLVLTAIVTQARTPRGPDPGAAPTELPEDDET